MKTLQSVAKKERLTISNIKKISETDNIVVYEGDNSFKCITTNDALNPKVIGYSSAKHSSDNIGFRLWVKAAEQALSSNEKTTNEYTDLAQNSSLEPLMSTTWGQGTPYNNLCPVYNETKNYPSGCVATGMAQIMKYHNYPEKGVGYNGYSFTPVSGVGVYLSADFSNTYYDWDNMLSSYTGSYTEEQENAVATLMYHCGVAISMQYTADGSGAYVKDAATALRSNFSYNENIGIHYRDYYSEKEWMKLIYEELDNGRPVLYAGYDNTLGGHCFVIDGYDADGLFHVNWGWDGYDDGYFDLSVLKTSSSGSFSLSQQMLTGFVKPDVEIDHHSEVVGLDKFSLEKYTKGLMPSFGDVYNLSDVSFNGSVAVVLLGNDSTYVLKETRNSKKSYSFKMSTPNELCKLPVDLPDGTYRVYPASRDSLEGDWHPIHYAKDSVNSFILTCSNDSYTLTPETDASWQADIKSSGTTGIKEIGNPVVNNSSDIIVYDINGIEIARVKSQEELNNLQYNGIVITKEGNRIKKVIK